MSDISLDEGHLYTLDEAAKYLRCSKSTIYKLGQREEITLVKLGRHTRVTGDSLGNFIKQRLKPMVGQNRRWRK